MHGHRRSSEKTYIYSIGFDDQSAVLFLRGKIEFVLQEVDRNENWISGELERRGICS